MKKIGRFIADDRGIGENVFQLALIVIIVAAVLAVLAAVLSGIWGGTKTLSEGAEKSANKTNESVNILLGGNK